ncbi:MAG TPA: hypothetical protein VN442_06030 [Bryobacteraceae bacterium]|nr:hypothetical protein [Bryobacteraceae bacterium]
MAKRIMRRTAADNPYLHQDFHGALSVGLEYLERRFGPESVREYLWGFAKRFYAPLRADVLARGLAPLREYLERMYAAENGRISLTCSEDELVLRVDECPAVAHMRRHGLPVAPLFHETARTVNEAICEGTPFCAELLEYDHQTGRSVQVFRRRTK